MFPNDKATERVLIEFLLPENAEDIPTAEEKRGLLLLWNKFCTMKDLPLAGMEFADADMDLG